MACLSNGNSSSSPATTSSVTKFANVSCDRVVWRWLTRHDVPSRRTWVQKNLFRARRPGPCRSSSSEDIFSGPKYDEKATPIGSANTRSHFGPCNSLRCEMAPWRDWTSLTYMYGRSLWRGTYLWNTVLARFPLSNMAPVNVNKYLMSFYTPVWKTGRIMPWQCPSVRLSVCPSVRPSVRPSVFSGLFFNMLWDINLKLGIYIQ